MPENDRLSDCLGEIKLEFVERETTPQLLMKLSIQLHLARISLSDTVSFLEIFGVDRVRPTVHNWVRKAIYSRNLVDARITLRSIKR
jgi:transposase-like protein